jgi:hypothetical protein
MKSRVNTDLLYEVLDTVIAAEADGTWNQGAWIGYDEMCGTTACFAGYTLIVQGGQVLTRKARDDGGPEYIEAYGIQMKQGRVRACDIAFEAKEALGLTYEETDRLFNADNSLSTIKQIVDDIASEGARA